MTAYESFSDYDVCAKSQCVPVSQSQSQSQSPLPRSAFEARRVALLRACSLLDTPPETAFDRITTLATKIFHLPICFISLIDADRLWFKSRVGVDFLGFPRLPYSCLCDHTILDDAPDVLVVPDASVDDRFKDNPYVKGPPYIKFYAGAALMMHTPDGSRSKIGTLSIIDTKLHEFSAEEETFLFNLAEIVVNQINLRRELSRAHSMFISATSHNLRTPMAALELSLDNLTELIRSPTSPKKLQQGLTENVAQIRANIEMLKISIERGIKAALAHSVLEPDVANLDVINLYSLVKEGIGFATKALNISADVVSSDIIFERGVPETVTNDRDVILTALNELLTNAFRYTTSGTVLVRVSTRSYWIRIEVFDTGPGVEESLRKTIFVNPVSTCSTNDDASGFGCYTIRILMEKIGGGFGYRPNEPKGSVFWIEFRDLSFLSMTADERDAAESLSVPWSSLPLNATRMCSRASEHQPQRINAIVVDDNLSIRTLLAKLLMRDPDIGEVCMAENGEVALRLMRAQHFDLAVIDYLMPVMNGLDLIMKYRELEPTLFPNDFSIGKVTYILGSSCNASPDVIDSGLRIGMDEYADKPIKTAVIRSILRRIVASRAAEIEEPVQETSFWSQFDGDEGWPKLMSKALTLALRLISVGLFMTPT